MVSRDAAGARRKARRDEGLHRVVLEDLKREQISRTIREELSEIYRFYLDEEERERLQGMNRVARFWSRAWWLLRSLLLRLSPVRRVLLVVAIVFALMGHPQFQWGSVSFSFNGWPLAVLILLVLLMLELKDKLVARDEIELARQVQLSILPRSHPSLEGWSLWSSTVPANDVGGDLVDYIGTGGGRLGVVLGDVAGKGMGAALLSAKLQATLRALAPACPSLKELGRRLNETFHRDGIENRFATLLYLEISQGSDRVRWLNAGHNSALVFRASASGAVERLPASSYPVGMFPETSYDEGEVEVAAGDLLLLYSDGLSEARGPRGDEFGEERLIHLLARSASLPADALGRRLLEEVARFQEEERPHDDQSLVVVRRVAS